LLAQPTDNVVSYYPFLNRALDYTVNGKNGNPSNFIPTTDRLGKANAAISFNGVNTYVLLPSTMFASNTSFAVSLWFKFSGTVLRPADYGEQIIDFRGQYNFSVAYLQYNHPSNPKSVTFNIANSSASINCYSPNNSIVDGTWYHIVATYANNTMQLYLNGSLADSKTQTPPSPVSGYNNVIGKDYNMDKDRLWFNGVIDEIVLYNRGLTSSEVLALYNRGLTTNEIPEICASFQYTFTFDASGNCTNRNILLPKSAPVIVHHDSIQQAFKSPQEMLEDNMGDQKIIIYPNPTQGQLLVEIKGYQKETSSALYLYDLHGKLLISKTPANSTMELNLSDYQSGTYILKILIGEKTSEWKIVKE
jgi:hypothetical protein